MNTADCSKRTLLLSVFLSLGLAAIKFAAGHWGQSDALIADAVESSTDVLSSFIVFLGLLYAHRPADANHPYGHGKIEPLVTFVVVLFLWASAAIIAHGALENIRQGTAVRPAPWTLAVLAVIILWKEGAYRWVMRQSKLTHSTALAADAWHHRSDAISSIMAFAGISFALLLGPGYESADDWAALAAALLIVFNSYQLFRPALGEIMDEHRYDEMLEAIRTLALEVPGVETTEKCFIRKVGTQFHVDLHAHVQGQLSVHQGHQIAHALKDHLQEKMPQIGQVLIHIEPAEEGG